MVRKQVLEVKTMSSRGRKELAGSMMEKYYVVVNDAVSFLEAMMKELSGNAHISLEGNIKKCDFSEVLGASSDQTEVLKRITFFLARVSLCFP